MFTERLAGLIENAGRGKKQFEGEEDCSNAERQRERAASVAEAHSEKSSENDDRGPDTGSGRQIHLPGFRVGCHREGFY